MKQFGWLCATLLAVMPHCAAGANIGYETVSAQPDGTAIVNSYSDSGALLGSRTSPVPGNFAAPLVTNTVYLDATSLGDALPASSTLIQENFNTPADLSVSEPLTFSSCDSTATAVIRRLRSSLSQLARTAPL